MFLGHVGHVTQGVTLGTNIAPPRVGSNATETHRETTRSRFAQPGFNTLSPKHLLIPECEPRFWVRKREPVDMRLQPQGKIPVPERLIIHQQLPLKCR